MITFDHTSLAQPKSLNSKTAAIFLSYERSPKIPASAINRIVNQKWT